MNRTKEQGKEKSRTPAPRIVAKRQRCDRCGVRLPFGRTGWNLCLACAERLEKEMAEEEKPC